MKRLGIYVVYDKDNIVDAYIGYMLKELRSCVDDLTVVYHGEEIIRGKEILLRYADRIFYRVNRGFDAGGFKDALCDCLGWEKVLLYDELVLANDSMFGPLRPMRDIFTEMEERTADFWGAMVHGKGESDSFGKIAEHVQSYFMVIRSTMLHCPEFRNYWEELPYFKTFREAILLYEVRFTSVFAKLGYSYAALTDSKINDSVYNFNQYAYLSYELIRKRNFPFLKRQQIAYNTLKKQTQENLRQSLIYIDKETNYDVNLIWDHIIRIFNATDLQRSLHLQYIIPDSSPGVRDSVPCPSADMHTAVLVFVEYSGSAEYIMEYLGRLPSGCEIRIFTGGTACPEEYVEYGCLCERFEPAQMAQILSAYCGRDYVCVLHDADLTSDHQPSYVGKSYFYNIWENLIGGEGHVKGIRERFADESRLGFLAPPQADFGTYFGDYGRGWQGAFPKIYDAARALSLNCRISEETAPFRIADSFWVRGSVLRKLSTMRRADTAYLPYLWSFLSQDAGYYSGIVESEAYASMHEVNMQYYLHQTAGQIRQQLGDFAGFADMREVITVSGLRLFCMKYSRLYIYGAGEMAGKYKRYIPGPTAYVVSDGREKPDAAAGIPVLYLSELEQSEDAGIILCLNKQNQQQVIPLLEARGISHYFCV